MSDDLASDDAKAVLVHRDGGRDLSDDARLTDFWFLFKGAFLRDFGFSWPLERLPPIAPMERSMGSRIARNTWSAGLRLATW